MKDPQAEALYSILRSRVLGGHYPSGTALPSWRQLSIEAGVGLGVVRAAFSRLADEGLVTWEDTRALATLHGQPAKKQGKHRGTNPGASQPAPSARAPTMGGAGNLRGLQADVLRLLVESLAVGLAFLSRVDGDTLVIEAVDDRAGMGLHAGDVVPLCDSYCTTMLDTASPSLVVEDAQRHPDFAPRITTRTLGIGAYSGVPLYHADGRLYGTLCTLHPTARAVEASELSLLKLAARIIMQAVDAGGAAGNPGGLSAGAVVVTDSEGRMLAWSEKLESSLAVRCPKWHGRYIWELAAADDRMQLARKVRLAMEGGRDIHTPCNLLNGGMTPIRASVALRGLKSGDGRGPLLFVSVEAAPQGEDGS